MDLYDIAVARKLSGGGGGGGSSDFSTAEVTINGMPPFIADVATLTDDGLRASCFKGIGDGTITVVLYKGSTILEGNNDTPEFTVPAGETNISYDSDEDYWIITGDCTITIS